MRLQELIDFLSNCDQAGRSRVANSLLNLSGEARSLVFGQIEALAAKSGFPLQPKPMSTYGEARLTVIARQGALKARDSEIDLEHVQALTLLHGEPDRLLLQLNYGPSGRLVGASWQTVSTLGLSGPAVVRLKTIAERLRRRRLEKAKSVARELGRNDPCPCGSGKKYKRCCLV